jgi:hypothetical protein
MGMCSRAPVSDMQDSVFVWAIGVLVEETAKEAQKDGCGKRWLS